MMTAEHTDARDVTPANLRREQQARESQRLKAVALKTKIKGIEKTIVRLNKEGADSKIIKAQQESWEYHNAELKKLEGK